MIDTIKVAHSITDEEWQKISKNYSLTEFNNGIKKIVINPTSIDKKSGIYKPRITAIRRPSISENSEILMEFSAPKLLFGNNFDEISTNDFPSLWEKIQGEFNRIGISLSKEQVRNLTVRKIDFCKNIPLDKYTTPSLIISHISRGDFPINKDIQKVIFRNGGQILHIHTNSVDIAIYDKISDLKQSKISEKRSFEKDYYCQNSLSEIVGNLPQVLRFEVRINSSKYIKKELNATESIKLKDISTSKQAVNILLKYWRWLLNYTPSYSSYLDSPLNKLLSLSQEKLSPSALLSRIGIQAILAENCDMRSLRNIFDKIYGKHAWRRIKPLLRQSEVNHNNIFAKIEGIIIEHDPMRIKDFIFVK